jgi:hypothetical protein
MYDCVCTGMRSQVRRNAAEQLYTTLLTVEADEGGGAEGVNGNAPLSVEAIEEAGEVLSATAWDGPGEVVRPMRSRLYALFGLPEPVRREGGGVAAAASRRQAALAAAQTAAAADENASYSALVERSARGW